MLLQICSLFVETTGISITKTLDPLSLQRTCEANAAGENSSFIFTVSNQFRVIIFKLAYEVVKMAVKEFFEAYF